MPSLLEKENELLKQQIFHYENIIIDVINAFKSNQDGIKEAISQLEFDSEIGFVGVAERVKKTLSNLIPREFEKWE